MKANELRIGNLVTYENPHSDRVQIEVDISTLTYMDNIDGIPLTEEWLLKFGFNKFPGLNKTYDTDNFWSGELVRKGMFKIPHLELTIKYVHQLQNLYFALTGEELIIKI